MQIKAVVSIYILLETAYGHGLVSNWTDLNSASSMAGWEIWKKPKTAAWYAENGDNGFVPYKDINTPEIICHKKASPGVEHFTVKEGDRIQMEWNAWSTSHKGPILTYLAPCPGDCTKVDKGVLKWTKIEERGYDGGQWATDVMMTGNKKSFVRIPNGLKAGAYVLRHEAIALHTAQSQEAQFYPQCVNLKVTGSGTALPSYGVPGTRIYQPREAGLIFDLYNQPHSSYTMPGPRLWKGRS
jgi:lytic cellulose monooxygenase (C1-hydroxylating)